MQACIPFIFHKDPTMKNPTVSLLASLALLAACATPSAAPVAVQSGVLTSPSGMTLYVFDKDSAGSGKSVCNGECAVKWPPLAAVAGDKAEGDYAIVTRDDGSRQWAYKGKPLYLWFKDQKPGDTTGDGVNNVWHAAKP
jgi:predicted lipoprotein with Yx(FWY)xxD motif